MNLLIDFGNTRLKWALRDAGNTLVGGVFAHADTRLATALGGHWSALPRPAAVHVASVVGAAREQELAELVRTQIGLEARFVRSPKAALGVTNAYAEPARLGVDRFLALAALHHAAQRAQVLVSCGTALTLDALDASGQHLGGLIAPSPTLMRKALGLSTAQVDMQVGSLVDFANNTADAAWSGSALAAVGLVRHFLEVCTRRLGAAPHVVGDGGGIEDLLAQLPMMERGRDLVLQGLALWAESSADAG